MIQHAVIFNLRYSANSSLEKIFFDGAAALASIPGVTDFQLLKQTNAHNSFKYGIAMKFYTKAAYNNYTNHPQHQHFIEHFWKDAVDDFLEIDYEPLAAG